jgi:hypothetical protein
VELEPELTGEAPEQIEESPPRHRPQRVEYLPRVHACPEEAEAERCPQCEVQFECASAWAEELGLETKGDDEVACLSWEKRLGKLDFLRNRKAGAVYVDGES